MGKRHTKARAGHFGDWLKQAIAERLITQREFSRRSGFTTQTICEWANDRRPPLSILSIVRIARALEVPQGEVEKHLLKP